MVAKKIFFPSQNSSLKTHQSVDIPFWYTVLMSYDTMYVMVSMSSLSSKEMFSYYKLKRDFINLIKQKLRVALVSTCLQCYFY